MLNFLKKQIDLAILKQAAIYAFIYLLFFNSVIIYQEIFYHHKFSMKFAIEIVTLYIGLLVIFNGLLIHKRLFIITSFFLFVLSSIAIYFILVKGYIVSYPNVKIFLNNLGFSTFFVMPIKMLLSIIFGIVIYAITISHFSPMLNQVFITRILSVVCLLLFLNNIIDPQGEIFDKYLPISFLHNGYLYFFK